MRTPAAPGCSRQGRTSPDSGGGNPPLLSSQLRRIAIGIQFCKDISQASSVEGIMSGQIPRPFRSIALVAALLISGVGVAVPSATARADDCLTAPNSAAPQGSHWYYRLDRATQRQCWYTRAPGQPAQQVAAPATTGPAAACIQRQLRPWHPHGPSALHSHPRSRLLRSRSLPPSVAGQPTKPSSKARWKKKILRQLRKRLPHNQAHCRWGRPAPRPLHRPP